MVKFTCRLLGTRPRFALGFSVRLVRCIRLRTSSLRVHFTLESLQRDTRRGRRDLRELRSQVPGVRLHGIDEARLVPVFFGRNESIVMHSGDGDAERVCGVAGLPCMFPIQPYLSLSSSRHTKAPWGLCGGEKMAVKRQGCRLQSSGH